MFMRARREAGEVVKARGWVRRRAEEEEEKVGRRQVRSGIAQLWVVGGLGWRLGLVES